MIVHNINPDIITVGGLHIRWYGLVYALGFLAIFFFLKWYHKKHKIQHLTSERIDTLLIYLIIGTILGGRLLLFLFYHPSIWWTDPLQILKIWEGGMSFHGALIGLVIAIILFCKRYKIDFYRITDLIVIPGALFLFFGRIANFVNGELWGIPSNVPWCVQFQGIEGCRHPSQLYEALKNLTIFFILLWIKNIKKLRKGVLTWSFIGLYGLLRFLVNFWRDDPVLLLGISTGQWLSLLMFFAATGWFIKNNIKKK